MTTNPFLIIFYISFSYNNYNKNLIKNQMIVRDTRFELVRPKAWVFKTHMSACSINPAYY